MTRSDYITILLLCSVLLVSTLVTWKRYIIIQAQNDYLRDLVLECDASPSAILL